MLRIASIVLLLFFSAAVSAQASKEKKPRILKQWTLSSDFTEELNLPLDTVFSLFHRHRISDRLSPVNATSGNYGLPFYPINFFDRASDHDDFLYEHYYPFLFLPSEAIFMDTQIPFTELVWTFGGQRETSEQTFRIRHSQNINRYLNFGLIYDIIFDLGQYTYQRAENKSFTFFSSYKRTRYKLYFSSGINNITSNENGGISDRDQLGLLETRDVAVNLGALNTAVSQLKNRNLLLVQRYTLGGQKAVSDSLKQKSAGFSGLSGTFSHIMTWENNRRTYTDSYPMGDFYDTVFISSTETFDSLYQRSFKNTIRFDFATGENRKFRLGGGVGLRSELYRYSQLISTPDTMLADTAAWIKNNNVLTGRLFNDIGEKFRWVATGELFLTGYRAGDFSLNGEITKSFEMKQGLAEWDISGSMRSKQPSFWYQQWGSNHFEWENNMKKEFRIDFGTSFSYPARKAGIKLSYAIIDNYTSFGDDALPLQHGGGLSVAAMMIMKEFRAWKFHLNTDLIIQKSSNSEILDLPLVATRSSAYFEHLFRFKQTNGKLNTQLGADLLYHTLYHPWSYMPATGRFYSQDEVKTGNYPFVNLFLNLKLKRTRIFIMFDHINSGFTGNNYFFIPSYPMNTRMLRYGLAWTFYN